jgi:hypothetical protein
MLSVGGPCIAGAWGKLPNLSPWATLVLSYSVHTYLNKKALPVLVIQVLRGGEIQLLLIFDLGTRWG